jgi:hypothetical protein
MYHDMVSHAAHLPVKHKPLEASPRQATGNLHRKQVFHFQIRSLIPPQAAGNALAFAVHGSEPYPISCSLPKQVLINDYPVIPRNFVEKLRKTRIDAGLMIKDLAKMLGVSLDTIIDRELRGISPNSQNL